MFSFDRSWTLFLDRDGVINEEKYMDYVNNWDEFVFYPNVPEAVAQLSGMFYKTLVVTNQKGVGKGLTPLAELGRIHANMVMAIEELGGHIDRIYYCPDLDSDSPNRKPNPGMALQAKADFPSIDLSKSIMIGNNASDMQFGRNAGIGCNILLTTTKPLDAVDSSLYDFHFDSLVAATLYLETVVVK